MRRNRKYQHNFSEMLSEQMYDHQGREQKARTMVAVLSDFLKADLGLLSVLDVGASTGIIANFLAAKFNRVIGIDIDESAIRYAHQHFQKDNLKFFKDDSMQMNFPQESFDVVICSQVYEHVPDAGRLMSEIFRVLKHGGVCYFAAGNRLNVMEHHYQLPFLSIIPRPIAHIYLRAFGKGKFYYEKHLTYWALKKLVCRFQIIDYTKKIIQQPEHFEAEYMLRPHSRKAKLARLIVNRYYWLCPTYIWLLKKTSRT